MIITNAKIERLDAFTKQIVFTYEDGSTQEKIINNDSQVIDTAYLARKDYYLVSHDISPRGFTGSLDYKVIPEYNSFIFNPDGHDNVLASYNEVFLDYTNSNVSTKKVSSSVSDLIGGNAICGYIGHHLYYAISKDHTESWIGTYISSIKRVDLRFMTVDPLFVITNRIGESRARKGIYIRRVSVASDKLSISLREATLGHEHHIFVDPYLAPMGDLPFSYYATKYDSTTGYPIGHEIRHDTYTVLPDLYYRILDVILPNEYIYVFLTPNFDIPSGKHVKIPVDETSIIVEYHSHTYSSDYIHDRLPEFSNPSHFNVNDPIMSALTFSGSVRISTTITPNTSGANHSLNSLGYTFSDPDVLYTNHLHISYDKCIPFTPSTNNTDGLGHKQWLMDPTLKDFISQNELKVFRHEFITKDLMPRLLSGNIYNIPEYPESFIKDSKWVHLNTISNTHYLFDKNKLPVPRKGEVSYLYGKDDMLYSYSTNFLNLESSRPIVKYNNVIQPSTYYDNYLRTLATLFSIDVYSNTVINDDYTYFNMVYGGIDDIPRYNNEQLTVGYNISNGKYFISSSTDTSVSYGEFTHPISITSIPIQVGIRSGNDDIINLSSESSGYFIPNEIALNIPELGVLSSEYTCMVNIENTQFNDTIYIGNYSVGSVISSSILEDKISNYDPSQNKAYYNDSDSFDNESIYKVSIKVVAKDSNSKYVDGLVTINYNVVFTKEVYQPEPIKVVMPNLTKGTDYTSTLQNGTDIDIENTGSVVPFYINILKWNSPSTPVTIYRGNTIIADSGGRNLLMRSDASSIPINGEQPVVLFFTDNDSGEQSINVTNNTTNYSFEVESFVVDIYGLGITNNSFSIINGNYSNLIIPEKYIQITDNKVIVTDLPEQWVSDNLPLDSSGYYSIIIYKTVVAGGIYSEYNSQIKLRLYPS